MIFNLFTVKWEGWAKWIEVCSLDLGWTHGSLLYVGKVERRWEFDLLFVGLLLRWWTWGRW